MEYLCLEFLKSPRVLGNRNMHLELLLKLNINSDATVVMGYQTVILYR